MIRVYLNEADRFDGKPLYQAPVGRCRTMNIAGSVFRGAEGFGDTAELHRAHILTHDSPVMITIVDTDENIHGADNQTAFDYLFDLRYETLGLRRQALVHTRA